MGNESGTWVMYGVDWDDPECIHTVEEATEYINRIGFLPLFKNDIPGFSLEERTVPEYWWCDDVDKDPWLWRTVIARGKDIVYSKFLTRKPDLFQRNGFLYLLIIVGMVMILMLCMKMEKHLISTRKSWITLWKKKLMQKCFLTNSK